MQKIRVQFDRLKRHYEFAEKTYDHASFLDLSHTLRIWVELKDVLPRIDQSVLRKTLFKSSVSNRRVLKHYSGFEYVVAFMPDGILTHAANGQLFACKEEHRDFSMGGVVAHMGGGAIDMKSFHFCSPADSRDLPDLTLNPRTTRLNYVQWMSAEIVRLNYRTEEGKLEMISIPREKLIKRVANILDGSHTSVGIAQASDNRFDNPIRHLMDFSCGGCPMPYYLLLKVAQDLVKFAPRIIPTEELA